MTPPRRHLPALLLYALLAALALAPLWPTDSVFGYRDLLVYFWPMRLFLRSAWLDGFFPYRNPFIACGNPFFANPEAQVLYPPAWCFALLGLHAGSVLYYGIHLLVGAIGANLLARRVGVSARSSLAVGIVFGFSGFAFSAFEVQNVLCDRFVPLVLWAALGVREHRSGSRLLVLAVFETLMLLGGEPSLMLAAHVVAMAILLWPPRVRARLPSAAAATVALVLGGWFQIGPTARYVLATDRVGGMDAAAAGQWSLSPWEVLEMASPGLLDGGFPAKLLGAQTYLPSVYLGILALALIAAGRAVSPWTRCERIIAPVGAAFGIVALGSHTPVFALYRAGTFGSVRYPCRFVSFVSLAVALLAGYAIDRVAARPRRGGAVLLGAAGLYVGLHLGLGLALPRLDSPLARGVDGGIVVLLAGVVLLAVRSALRVPLLLLLLALDALFIPDRPWLYTVPASALESPVCDADWRGRLEGARYRVLPLPQPAASWQRTFSAAPAEQPREASRAPFGLAVMVCGDRSAAVEPVLPLSDYRAWMDPNPAIMARASVAAILVPRPEHPGQLRRLDVSARPRFSLAAAAFRDPGGNAGRRALAERPWREVMVADDAVVGSFGPGSVTTVTDAPNLIALDVDSEGEGLLVVTERHDDGWQATVDGIRTGIVPCDRMFMALPVPAGHHRVELGYRETGVAVGLMVSATFWMAAVLSLVVRSTRARRHRASS